MGSTRKIGATWNAGCIDTAAAAAAVGFHGLKHLRTYVVGTVLSPRNCCCCAWRHRDIRDLGGGREEALPQHRRHNLHLLKVESEGSFQGDHSRPFVTHAVYPVPAACHLSSDTASWPTVSCGESCCGPVDRQFRVGVLVGDTSKRVTLWLGDPARQPTCSSSLLERVVSPQHRRA